MSPLREGIPATCAAREPMSRFLAHHATNETSTR
jgi:hypothetical protein